jgi:enoyl-CoA hydratase
MPSLLVDVAGRVATVTLNRPEARNALDADLLTALPRAITALDARADVGAIVLTGADPAFCAGLDLKRLSDAGGIDAPTHAYERGPFPPRGTPIIGAINGPCVTGGLELALACDFLLASDRARFADTHGRVGILPGWGLTVLLPAAIGERRARQMSLTGNYVDAPTALAWGLVNEVVPHAQLVGRAQALAADIATVPAATIAAYRAMYEHVGDAPRGEAWRRETDTSAAWLATGFDRSQLAGNRAAIQARGRNQTRTGNG